MHFSALVAWLRRKPVVAFVIVILALWPQARDFYIAQAHWRALQQRGVLVVGIDPNTQPFSFYDQSGWNGLEADLTRELAQRLQLRLATEPVGYDALYDALKLERVDIIISSVMADPSQNEAVRYSQPYFDAGLRRVMLKEKCCPASDAVAFAHQRVAVALGSEADRAVRFWQRRVQGLERVEVISDLAALAALRQGQVDVAVLAATLPPDLIRNSTLDYRVMNSKPYVIGVKRQHRHLLAALNRTLDAMRRDGTLDKLVAKWLVG